MGRMFVGVRSEIELHWSENKMGLSLATVYIVGVAAAIIAA